MPFLWFSIAWGNSSIIPYTYNPTNQVTWFQLLTWQTYTGTHPTSFRIRLHAAKLHKDGYITNGPFQTAIDVFSHSHLRKWIESPWIRVVMCGIWYRFNKDYRKPPVFLTTNSVIWSIETFKTIDCGGSIDFDHRPCGTFTTNTWAKLTIFKPTPRPFSSWCFQPICTKKSQFGSFPQLEVKINLLFETT